MTNSIKLTQDLTEPLEMDQNPLKMYQNPSKMDQKQLEKDQFSQNGQKRLYLVIFNEF